MIEIFTKEHKQNGANGIVAFCFLPDDGTRHPIIPDSTERGIFARYSVWGENAKKEAIKALKKILENQGVKI